MAQTVIRGTQILNNTVQRQDLDTSTVGQAVVTKLVQGTGITLSSTGADSGTGDVTVTAASGGPPASTPVVLGETAADAFFTGGIIVPRYKNHPDSIWTYGTFDDHFDSPASGTPNAKWVNSQTSGILNSVYTQAGSKLCLGGTSPAATGTVYENSVVQQLPAQTTHLISLNVLFTAFPFLSSRVYLILNLERGARAAGISLSWSIGTDSSGYNYNYFIAYGGASLATQLSRWDPAFVPPYWQFNFNASAVTTISFSHDNITWMVLTSVTGAQAGLDNATNAPTQFRMGIQSTFQAPAFAQIDWIKHV